MPRSRVPIKGSIGKSILTGKSSTTVQNITVVQQVTKQTSGGTGGVASTIWPLISQIPSNVLDLAALSTAGITVFNGSDIITRALAVISPLTIANATGAAGNPTISFATQGAHAVLAGPTPSFRSLTTADLPTIPAAQISGLATVATTGLLTDLSDVTISAVATNDVLEWNGSAWVNGAGGGGGSPLTTKGDLYGFDTANARVPVGADGDVLTADSGAALGVSWQPSAGGGTVTSVGIADLSSTPIYAVSTTPVTSIGTLDLTLLAQSANRVFAGPATGSSAQPAFRALTTADIPTLPVSKISGLATVATTGLLSSLGDVTISAVATSQILTYNGSKWTNQTPSGPSLANVDPDTHPATPDPMDDEFEGTAISAAWASHVSSGGSVPVALSQGAYIQTATGSGTLILLQAVPLSASYEFTIKTWPALTTTSASWGVGFYNIATGNALIVAQYTGDWNTYAQRGNFNSSTWVYTFSTNQMHTLYTPLTTPPVQIPQYIRIGNNGVGTINTAVSTVGYNNTYFGFYNELISAYLGTITHVFVAASVIGGSGQAAASMIDWFRRTA